MAIIGSNKESILREFEEKCHGINLIDAEGQCLLEAPLGLNALDLELQKKKIDLAGLCDQFLTIPAQQAFFLMRNCFAFPNLMYLLCTSAAFKCGHKLAELTQLMRDTFERITNVAITDEAWAQTILPVKLGGFGLQSPLDIASSAYISSSISRGRLVRNAPLLGYGNGSASPSKEKMPPVIWNRSLTHQAEAINFTVNSNLFTSLIEF